MLGESVREPGPPLPLLTVFAVSIEDGSVVTDAVIAFNGDVADLDENGAAATTWYERSITVRAEAAGYAPNRVEVDVVECMVRLIITSILPVEQLQELEEKNPSAFEVIADAYWQQVLEPWVREQWETHGADAATVDDHVN